MTFRDGFLIIVFMKITVRPEESENNLLRLLQKAGAPLSAPCGGNGHCGKCRVLLNGSTVLACRTTVDGPAEVEIPDRNKIVSEIGSHETNTIRNKKVNVAVDIGTTTVAVALTVGEEIVASTVFDNPQIAYGSDVLSRIQASKKSGVEALKKPLLSAVGKAVEELNAKYGTNFENVFVCGNTVMLHIFWGEDVASLGVAPYTPKFLDRREGVLPAFGQAKVVTLPCVSSYVGADIVAGLTTLPPPEKGKVDLFIDLGTNAEIALIDEKTTYVTSASAGPCFEGGNISCGMPATDGAIKSFSLEDGKSTFSYFGLRPTGLCGSGLIDVVGQLVKNGIIDETGYLKAEKGYLIAQNVILTQNDVRAYQTAKSAVKSGIDVLLLYANKSYADVGTVYLSGGFSRAIDVKNVILSGLLPGVFSDKCVPLGNSALSGAAICSVHPEKAEKIVSSARYVDLGGLPLFSELFIKNLDFKNE